MLESVLVEIVAVSGKNCLNIVQFFNARISVIEAELKHLATKEDVQKINTSIEEVKTLIGNKESKILRWLMGIISAAVISLIVALVKTFQS